MKEYTIKLETNADILQIMSMLKSIEVNKLEIYEGVYATRE